MGRKIITRFTDNGRPEAEITMNFQKKIKTFPSIPNVKQLGDGEMVKVYQSGNLDLYMRHINSIYKIGNSAIPPIATTPVTNGGGSAPPSGGSITLQYDTDDFEIVNGKLALKGGPGVTDHALLTHLDYAHAEHTGFESTVTKGNLAELTSAILTITGGSGAVIGAGVTITVKQASAIQNGYLSSVDWSAFSGKQSALSFGNLTAGSSKLSIGGTGSGAVIGTGVSVDVAEGNITHNNLGGLQGGVAGQYSHLTDAQISALHSAITISDTNSINLSLTDQLLSADLTIQDTTSVDLGIDASGLKATVLPAGVDHDFLANYSADKHVGHSGVSISAGTGMSGGGDLTTTRTLTCTITQYSDSLARASISSSATGLTYTSGTGVLSLTAGYVIPTTTEESNWNSAYGASHAIATVGGAPLTLSGQQISFNYDTGHFVLSGNNLQIKDEAVTFAKMQHIATASLLGRTSVLTGDVENLTDIPTGITIGTKYIYRADGTDVPVVDGGTGLSAFALGSIPVANTANVITALTSVSGLKALKNNDGVLSWGNTTGTDKVVFSDSPFITTKLNLETTWKKALTASDGTKTIYVDQATGNDTTGDGTSALPFATVMKAINVLPRIITEATVIAVGVGNYDETITLTGIQVLSTLTIKAMDLSDRNLYNSGTAESGGNTTITDTDKAWATNLFSGGKVWIWYGTGKGQAARTIASNTSNEITVTSAWDTNPDSTSKYVIVGNVNLKTITSKGNAVLGYAINNLSIYGLQILDYTSYSIIFYGGTSISMYYCYIDCNRACYCDGVAGLNYFYWNFCSLLAAQGVAAGLVLRGSQVDIRGSVFVAETQATDVTAIYASILSVIKTTSSYCALIKDCVYGVQLNNDSQVFGTGGITYNNCTYNIIYSAINANTLLVDSTVTITSMTTAGFVKNAVTTGLLSGGNALVASDIPISSSATGLTYTTGTGVLSLTAGYVIPTTTEETNWNSAYSASHTIATISDTSSIDLTLSGQQISGVVLPAGVDHNSLANYSANKHIDHTSVSITNGNGITGGGDLSASRTLALTTLTSNWDIGASRSIQAEKIIARSNLGLALYEDGGVGIFIKDGGSVIINDARGLSSELVINGDFETSANDVLPAGWTNSGLVNFLTDTGKYYGGAKGVEVYGNATSAYGYQSTNLFGGSTYSFSVWIKAGTADPCRVVVYDVTASETLYDSGSDGTTSWHQKTTTFMVSGIGVHVVSIRLYCTENASSRWWADDVSLKEVTGGILIVGGSILANIVEVRGALAHEGTTVGFYGGTPVTLGAALTTQLTTITHTAPGTPDYALQNLVQNTGFGFVTADEGNSVLKVIANLQIRVAELEARLGSATGVKLFT